MHPTPDLPSHEAIRQQITPLRLWESWMTVLLPLGVMGLYGVLVQLGLYAPAFGCIFYLSFVTYGSCSHDLVHANCGLSRKVSHFWLSVIELLMMRSGTVYRVVHLNHHRLFPDYERDPEGRASYYSLPRTLLEGPLLQPRLCVWALRNTTGRRRRRVIIELFLLAAFAAVGVALWPVWPALLVYQILVIMGSWTIPLITSYLVHLPHGESPIQQTRLFRGVVFRVIALDHLYHLEHHLYPQVSHYRWRELAEILNPHFAQAKIAVVSVPATRTDPYAIS